MKEVFSMLKEFLFDDSLSLVSWALGLRIYSRCMPHGYPAGDPVPLVYLTPFVFLTAQQDLFEFHYWLRYSIAVYGWPLVKGLLDGNIF